MTLESIPLDLWAFYVEAASVAIAPVLGLAVYGFGWIVRPRSESI